MQSNSSLPTNTIFSSFVYQTAPSQNTFEWWDPLMWGECLNDALLPSLLYPAVAEFAQLSGRLSRFANATFQSNPFVELPNAQTAVRRTRRRLNERQRLEILQNDEFILSFSPTKVDCAGCGKTIQMDKRNNAHYYPHFWVKHKSRCAGVARGIVSDLKSWSPSMTPCTNLWPDCGKTSGRRTWKTKNGRVITEDSLAYKIPIFLSFRCPFVRRKLWLVPVVLISQYK